MTPRLPSTSFRLRSVLLLAALAAFAPAQDSLRERAAAAENRGDFQTAADAYLKLVAAEPGTVQWIVEAGRCLGRSSRFATAIDLLEDGRKKFPDYVEVPAMLARVLLLKAEYDPGALDREQLWRDAAELTEGVLKVDPQHEDSRLLLAQARYLLGDWEQAVAQAEEAVRQHPGRPGAQVLIGRIALDRMTSLLHSYDAAQASLSEQARADLVAAIATERKRAKDAFSRAAELDPSRAHPHLMLAKLALLDRHDGEVRQHLMDALAIDPDAPVEHARLAIGGDWQQLAAAYADCLQRYAARPDAVAQKRATLRWYEAKALFDGRQWQAARKGFEQALAENPAATNSHYYIALCAYELGDHDAALQHAGEYAAVSAPAFADVVLSLQGDTRGEVAALVKYLADRAYQQGDKAKSRDLNHVTALVYDTADAWNNCAFLCRETGKFDEALSAYRRALEKEPNSPQLLNDTAVVLHDHLGTEPNRAEAVALCRRAIAEADKILASPLAGADAKARAEQAKKDAALNLADWK